MKKIFLIFCILSGFVISRSLLSMESEDTCRHEEQCNREHVTIDGVSAFLLKQCDFDDSENTIVQKAYSYITRCRSMCNFLSGSLDEIGLSASIEIYVLLTILERRLYNLASSLDDQERKEAMIFLTFIQNREAVALKVINSYLQNPDTCLLPYTSGAYGAGVKDLFKCVIAAFVRWGYNFDLIKGSDIAARLDGFFNSLKSRGIVQNGNDEMLRLTSKLEELTNNFKLLQTGHDNLKELDYSLFQKYLHNVFEYCNILCELEGKFNRFCCDIQFSSLPAEVIIQHAVNCSYFLHKDILVVLTKIFKIDEIK